MTPEKQQMIDWLHAHGACLDGREWAERGWQAAYIRANFRPDWSL